MERIENYKNYHKGQTCAILGGGPSLPYDLRNIEDVDVLIGVNQHSLILPCDYIVFSDRHMWPLIEPIKFIDSLNHPERFFFVSGQLKEVHQ